MNIVRKGTLRHINIINGSIFYSEKDNSLTWLSLCFNFLVLFQTKDEKTSTARESNFNKIE